jgi:Fur family transcriptional regulator, ferric uptake regulator
VSTPAPDPGERALAVLRAHGQRLTRPRRAVVAALAGLDGHPSAEDVGAEVARIDPGVHRATVYRTLDTLADLGVVSHVHSHGTTAYHLADPGADDHLHARCRSCDRVVDLPGDLLDDAVGRVRETTGFRVEPAHVALSGTCASCSGD